MRKVNDRLSEFLDEFNHLMKGKFSEGFEFNVINVRETSANLISKYVTDTPEIASIRDGVVYASGYDIPIRVFIPYPDEVLPVLVYFHGGGHVAGSVASFDSICRKISRATKHIVVAPEYRLAPESRYPCGVTDCYAVVTGVWTALDRMGQYYQPSLSVAGDSAGGALAATMSHLAQFDYSVKIKKQVLIYPVLDYTMRLKSHQENAAGYFLETRKSVWYLGQYFREGQCRREASPLFMDFTAGLPETLVFTVEFCPHRDAGDIYFRKVEEVGVRSENIHFTDMIHPFLNFEELVKGECSKVYSRMNSFLND
ncbi:alpha/beta hydrolase [Microbulbifer sp. OS29]|uniref:Alpha/beta hydrolase n=1 Tax=Microbulbifer okhotskensis TaxID=2926617 RepID=A0A9X2EJ65_9GAMM|nr:alpha/beta hydrolase [Microbulbifer okhotskensis]MCO1333212.1 alpha/beta hydrolase [Microbulbifer okhotskensis]